MSGVLISPNEKEIRNTIQLTVVYLILGISLSQVVKHLYNENYKTLKKKIEDIRKCK
jgi:hypothetical protein